MNPIAVTERRLAVLLACLLGAAGIAALASTPAGADQSERSEAATACEDAAILLREDDLDGALEEARWCLESLQQIRQNRTLAIFPDAVERWTGGELDRQSAMGMNVLSRTYTREADSIEVTLTSGAAGSGLAALAQMGLAMGSGTGKKIRVQKRTVLDMSEPDAAGANYIVQLRSGGMLNVESGDTDADTVLEFLRAFPIVEVDDALEN